MHSGTRAALMASGMFGNTFYVGVPVLTFLYGPDAPRYAAFNDMLMTMPWYGVWVYGSVRSRALPNPPACIRRSGD